MTLETVEEQDDIREVMYFSLGQCLNQLKSEAEDRKLRTLERHQ